MRIKVTIVVLLLLAPLQARADTGKEEPFAGFTKYERYHAHYEVNANGTHVETQEWALKVLTEQGVSDANQTSISFSDRLQEAEILSAYTLKKDGRRIDAPPSNFQVETNTGNGDASPMFSDIKTKTVVFPDVAVGDTVVMSYKLTQKEALFPGHFSLTQSFSKFAVFDDVKISLSVPNALELWVEARGVEGGEVAPTEGHRNWVWSYRNKEVARPETAAVAPLDYGPLIIASTFKDYGAIAAAYEARANPKAAVTDRIQKQADELTQNSQTPREQAKALYNWVAKNIKFAGNCVGVGSVVPHEADLVLANRLGDCKDHTALLQSLLSAKGIASTPVLINSGSAYALPEVPSIAVFNHVINYISSLDLYVDSTAEYMPFGSLPPSESGKPAIHTAEFTGIRWTPATDYKENRSDLKTDMRIRPDGSAEGETKIEVKGLFAMSIRAWMTYLQPNMEDVTIRRALASNGYTGTGTILRAEAKELTESYSYGSKYRIEDALNLPGPGAMVIRSPFASSAPIASFLHGINEPERTTNFQCVGGYSSEEYTIHLPKAIKVQALPKDVQLNGKRAAYRAKYRVKGNTVTIVRELEDRTPGNVCTPQDQAEFQPFAAAVLRDLRAQLIYR